MSLLEKYAGQLKDYTSREQETVDVVITNIRGTKDDRRVMLDTNSGQFFAFKNSFPNGVVPVLPKAGLEASITLEQNGEYINVVSIKYDVESLGKFNAVASFGNTVAL